MTFGPGLRGSVDAVDPAGITQAYAAANTGGPQIPDARPLFQSMFSDRARAIAQTVNELWTPPGADANASRPLTLFGDAPSDPRKLFGS